ncbi:MauE/DoxX family redox-associated membrane protein [Microbacterium sp. ASV49]|uniref:MauE/DoxX family redox-associated membrane protein n=1 Tax=Microbacterium candidum TaxID=3041922 RepID=A0ABT7MV36_9MICO|nr:MauE/DoxX family redox-associated membrane protein [Microbacterium sp. ASV49]MDL9978283.1 MauE/DoxX family redox-associated membrane protein [Microbacterium sp. ASV49]
MPAAFPIAFPLVLAAVLVASAIAKLRTPDDLAGWADLGVPAAFRRDWLRRLHPWGELVLGLAVALLGGWLGLLAALAAVALMLVYAVLVARVAARADDTSCACFGARKRVTRVTVARNVWLTVLAVASTAVIWTTPLLGGALSAGIPDWSWLVALAVAGVTTAFVLWPDEAEDATKATDAGGLSDAMARAIADAQGDDELDYIRTRTPAVPVTLADGSIVNLRTLSMTRPILLLAVSSTCGVCEPVYVKRDEYRQLLPEVDVRLLLTVSSDESGWTETTEPQSLHDVGGYVRGSISDWATPSAVLLGGDGLLAGGPVTGHEAIDDFVGDIYESLHGERPPAEAPSPA